MNSFSKCLVLLVMITSCARNAQQKSSEWHPLFNGKDLTGWHIKIAGQKMDVNHLNTFTVEDSIIKIRYDAYGKFNRQFGALYTDRPYKNYRLKLDFRFVGETCPGAPSWGYQDSGIQYHGQSAESMDLGQEFPIALEYNLHGGNGRDERPCGEICANGTLIDLDGKAVKGCQQPLVKRTILGGVWATAEIEVKDGVIRQFINGEEIISFTNPRYDAEHAKGKTFIKNGKAELTQGYISLQSNSHPIDFRNIYIKEY